MRIQVATLKFMVICVLWMALELLFYRRIQPSGADDIIGLVLWYYIWKGEREE